MWAWTLRQFVENIRGGEQPERDPASIICRIDNRRIDGQLNIRNGKGTGKPRDLSKVDTICIHQMAVEVGTRSKDVAEHGKIMALCMRFYEMPYHDIVLPRSRMAVWNNSYEWHTYHGNDANPFSIGFAIEGKYPGSNWGESEIYVSKLGLRLAVERARKLGCPIKYVTPHRSWSWKRLADPGVQIWRDVVAPMMKELDLQICPRGPKNGGKLVPKEWLPLVE